MKILVLEKIKVIPIFCLLAGVLTAQESVQSVREFTDTRDYTLTISCEHGETVPSAGVYSNYCWNSAVTCSLVSVTSEYHLFSGWNLDSELEDVDGDGIIDSLVATSNSEVIVSMNELSRVATVLFDQVGSPDVDDDDLLNSEEWVAGSDPYLADTDEDGFEDGFEVDRGLDPTLGDESVLTYIQNRSDTFGLYASNDVLDVALGQVLIEVQDEKMHLSLQLEESEDLVTWTNSGSPLGWDRAGEQKKFFRISGSK